MNRRRCLATALAALVWFVAGGIAPAHAEEAPSPSQPGTYVDELPSGGGIIAAATGVVLFVGAGRAAPQIGTASTATTVTVTSVAAFQQQVLDPSPALMAAVDDFFVAGGAKASVVLTADERSATLVAALGATPDGAGTADLLVVPALGALDSADYLAVVEALDARAVPMGALVLLDPPTAIVAGAVANGDLGPLMAVADQVRSVSRHPERVVLYTSGLIDTVSGQAVPAAAAMAGIMASVDASVGFWGTPAGMAHPLVGLRPSLHLTTAEASTANDNHLVPFMTFPGYGTVAWGDLTIGTPDVRTYVSVQRAMVAIESSIRTGLVPFVFDANGPRTWTAVNQTITAFLTMLWTEGALAGDSPAQAFSVAVGLGSTMTGEDILQGIMNVEVQVALVRPAEFVVLTFQQEMQTS